MSWFETRFLMITLLAGGTAVLTASLFGLAALWAMRGPVSWLWRWSPVVLLLAALTPIGAYELLAVYASEVIVVVVALGLGPGVDRWFAARRSSGEFSERAQAAALSPALRAPQFHLGDVLKGVLLACAGLAILRHAVDTELIGTIDDFLPWIAVGALLGAVTVAAAWGAWGRGSRNIRGLALLIATACVCALLEGFQVSLGFIDFFNYLTRLTVGWWTLEIFSQEILTLTVLCLLGRARVTNRGGGNDAAERGIALATLSSLWRQPVRLALLGILFVVASSLGATYWALLPPVPPPLEALPSPNGFDDLVRAGNSLNWTAVPNADGDEATMDACQAFMRDNAAQLSLLREGLDTPCRCPFDFTMASMSGDLATDQAMRSLCRALWIEAKAATAGDCPGSAITAYLDAVRLSEKLSHGSSTNKYFVAEAIAGDTFDRITRCLTKLDPVALNRMRLGLEEFSNRREPLGAILEREWAWNRLAFGWYGRYFHWIDELTESDYRISEIRTRSETRSRLLTAEAAVRRHVLLQGAPPQSLASIVPEYLAWVPIDPYSNRPLVYRRTDDGYLLYSVGSNRVDDGGQRVSFLEATTENKGDLFFDAPYDNPEAQNSNAAANSEVPASEP